MPPFDPNQLGGPEPMTMGSLMGGGPISRGSFPPMAGAPPMTGPPMNGGPSAGGMPPGMPGMPPGLPPGMPMPGGPGGPGGGPPMPPPGAGGPMPPGMDEGPGEPPGPPTGPPAGAAPPPAPSGPGGIAAVQQAADDAAIHAALETTKNDPDEAVKMLARSGHQSAGQKLQQAARLHRQRELQKRSELVSDQQAAYRVGKQLLSSVSDDSSLRVVKEMFGQYMPAFQKIGDSYQEAAPRIQQFLEASAPMGKLLDQQQQTLQAMQTALRTGDHHEWRRAAAMMLSTAKDPGQWQSLIGQLKQAGAPLDVLNSFDTVYSEKAVSAAKQLAERDGKSEPEGGSGFEDMGLLAALR